MRKFFAVVLVLVCVCSCASAADMGLIFSTSGPTDGTGDMFDGDYFAMTLYMTSDLDAYIQTTVWDGKRVTSSIDYVKIRSKVGSKDLYFVYADGSYITGHYDPERDYKFWLNFEKGSIRLTIESNSFSSMLDYKEAGGI